MKFLLNYYFKLIKEIETELPLFISGIGIGGRTASFIASHKYKELDNLFGVIALGYPFYPEG
jgi:predicted alpha/beta-hydrolase family hydrolase